MKRFILAVFVLTVGVFVWTATALEGQDLIIDSVTGEPVARKAEVESLREQYIELMRENVDQMTEEELRAALEAAQVQNRERLADARLAEAGAILTELIAEHPSTAAANIARRMLECGESRRRDPNFQRQYDDIGESTPADEFRPR